MSTLLRTHRISTLPAMPNRLVLVRHGQSEWNKRNLFTGWKDPDLTDKGLIEARWAGRVLRDQGLKFDVAFTSLLRRAENTLDIILGEMEQSTIPIHREAALNERDYGELSGLDKDEAKMRFGEEQVTMWRRSFDVPPPGGESLKQTADRVLPYYYTNIWPQLAAGKNVIVVAHGNSLRGLIMKLEGLTGEEIIARELATAAPILYQLTKTGEVDGARRSRAIRGTRRWHGMSSAAWRRGINYRDSEKWIGVYIAVLAVMLALCAMGGGNAAKDATIKNIEATNTWAFFQAKNMRRHVLRLQADEMELRLATESGLTRGRQGRDHRQDRGVSQAGQGADGRPRQAGRETRGSRPAVGKARSPRSGSAMSRRARIPISTMPKRSCRSPSCWLRWPSFRGIGRACWRVSAHSGLLGALLTINGFTLAVAIPFIG